MRLPELKGDEKLIFDTVCGLSREQLLVDPDFGFGLTTATPLQRAICRLCDGKYLEELIDHPDIVSAIGDVSNINKPIREIIVISGVRVGKSLWAAMNSFFMAIHCDVEAKNLRAGEIPRATLVSVDKDLAAPLFNHVRYTILNNPALKLFLIKDSPDSITIRNRQNWPVEISVVANKKDGATVAARWCAGLIPDEAPRMSGTETTVNYTDLVRSARERLLPGTMVCSIGSPWAPDGPIFDLYTQFWKKPSNELIVVKCPAWLLNPYEWTTKRIEETKKNRPDEYVTECLGEFASPEDCLIPHSAYQQCVRKDQGNIPHKTGMSYRAAMDPALRGNAWSFVISTREGKVKKVAFTQQWQGSKLKPLSPKQVLTEIKDICRSYEIDTVHTDQYGIDFIREIAADLRLNIVQETWTQQKLTNYSLDFARMVLEGRVEFSPDPQLRADVLRVSKRVIRNGVSIHLPKTADGRHCDMYPALLLSMSRYIEDYKEEDRRTEQQKFIDDQEIRMMRGAKRRQGSAENWVKRILTRK